MATSPRLLANLSAGDPFPYPHPFRNCIVLGLMLGEDGNKMSKSKRNYREPTEIFDRYGADALRWYFFANQPPWTSIRYSEQAIKDAIPEFLLRLWNVYSFFIIYANIDGFDPAAALARPGRAVDARSACHGRRLSTAGRARRAGPLDSQRTEPHGGRGGRADGRLRQLRRLRDADRVCRCLEQLVRPPQPRPLLERRGVGRQERRPLDALRVPADDVQADRPVRAVFGRSHVAKPGRGGISPACDGESPTRPVESVHLCDYPIGDPAAIDENLSARMALVREIVSLGRSARMGAKLKVRQPLSRVEVILANAEHQAWLEEHAALICDELNVKRVEFAQRADQYITYSVLPDLKRLGPRLGKRLPALRNCWPRPMPGCCWPSWKRRARSRCPLPDGPVELDSDDLQVRLQAKEGWAAAQGHWCVVVLSTELTEELVREGLARDFVRALQETPQGTRF